MRSLVVTVLAVIVLGSLGFLIYKDINLQRSLNSTNQTLAKMSQQIKAVNNNVSSTDSDVQQVCSSLSQC